MNSQQVDIHGAKRDVAEAFRERMAVLIARKGNSLAAFAREVGLDRSALSQFLAPGSTRLPRAETLAAIARTCGVSLDWLLGLIASEEAAASNVPMLEMVETMGIGDNELLTQWHREATGYKIRYVPATLPDLLRTPEVAAHEFASYASAAREAREEHAREQLTYSRRPETDMEVCMPLQTLETFAAGQGIWTGLSAGARRAQLNHMAALIGEMYPTFRLFLFDERRLYASPYTVFGPKRAAVYLGNLYFVVNSAEHIRELSRHFDNLIRIASIGPDRAEEFLRGM